jgi:2-C-methyl-D-erythritol 4-phosphate cytidylyltransferase
MAEPNDPRLAVLLLTAPPPGVEGDQGPYVKVEGRECLRRSAELFSTRDDIAQILAVFATADAEDAKQRFGGHLAFSGVKIGPPTDGWYGQIKTLASRIEPEITHVLVHDAARPAVAITDLDALSASAAEHPQAAAALSADVETGLVETDGQGRAVGYRPADAFRLLLWPRLYPTAMLAELAEGREPPADKLRLVPGLPLNIRCNRPADAKRVAALIKLLPEPKREGPLSPFDEAKW